MDTLDSYSHRTIAYGALMHSIARQKPRSQQPYGVCGTWPDRRPRLDLTWPR